jgi:hypothetical protein
MLKLEYDGRSSKGLRLREESERGGDRGTIAFPGECRRPELARTGSDVLQPTVFQLSLQSTMNHWRGVGAAKKRRRI